MANPTSEASGTQSATVTTEHTLRDVTGAGTYQLIVDLGAMLAGDVTELRVYEAVLTGGTLRLVAFQMFAGAQEADKLEAHSAWFPNLNVDAASLRFTLKQTFGTSRSYPWEVRKYS